MVVTRRCLGDLPEILGVFDRRTIGQLGDCLTIEPLPGCRVFRHGGNALSFARFEFLVAGRYLRARRKERFVSVIALLTLVGVMLGVATLIIVMAVMNGFRTELISRILGINGHMIVQPIDQPLNDYADLAKRFSAIPGVTNARSVSASQSASDRLSRPIASAAARL